jgi:hypothetical protein
VATDPLLNLQKAPLATLLKSPLILFPIVLKTLRAVHEILRPTDFLAMLEAEMLHLATTEGLILHWEFLRDQVLNQFLKQAHHLPDLKVVMMLYL